MALHLSYVDVCWLTLCFFRYALSPLFMRFNVLFFFRYFFPVMKSYVYLCVCVLILHMSGVKMLYLGSKSAFTLCRFFGVCVCVTVFFSFYPFSLSVFLFLCSYRQHQKICLTVYTFCSIFRK